MGHESAARGAAHLLWLLLVSVAAALLLFDGSQDGSLVGGRFGSAVIWPVLWIGTLAIGRPPLVPDAVSVGIAIGGIPFVLVAPSVPGAVFVAVVAVLWATLTAAYFVAQRGAVDGEAVAR